MDNTWVYPWQSLNMVYQGLCPWCNHKHHKHSAHLQGQQQHVKPSVSTQACSRLMMECSTSLSPTGDVYNQDGSALSSSEQFWSELLRTKSCALICIFSAQTYAYNFKVFTPTALLSGLQSDSIGLRVSICVFTTVCFWWFSSACLSIFGWTTKSNGLFWWTSDGLRANQHP